MRPRVHHRERAVRAEMREIIRTHGDEPPSYLMDYGPDWPPEPETAPKPRMSLRRKILAYAIIPAVAIWIIGQACFYVRAHIDLERPTSQTTSHGSRP